MSFTFLELKDSVDEWDRYETANWHGQVKCIVENPAHLDLPGVRAYLHESQEEYMHYGREYFGWALYLLSQTL